MIGNILFHFSKKSITLYRTFIIACHTFAENLFSSVLQRRGIYFGNLPKLPSDIIVCLPLFHRFFLLVILHSLFGRVKLCKEMLRNAADIS